MMFDCQMTLRLGSTVVRANLQSQHAVMGLFGPSGAGKTSILHAIAGLIAPQAGWIRINETTWFDQEKKINVAVKQRRVGLVFQDSQLFPHKTVMDNLTFGFNTLKPHERLFDPDDIVAKLQLQHLTQRMPSKLSGGEKQRTALGRALLYSPQVLLLDEPLSSLDRACKNQIMPLLKDLTTMNIPMIYVSHDPQEIEQLTPYVWQLSIPQ